MDLIVPPEVKQAVAFVYVPNAEGKPVANGTCFFVGKRHPSVANRWFVYAVTSGHVLRRNIGGPVFERIWLRLNTKAGDVDMIPLVIAGPEPTAPAFFHVDPTVDLAVMPILPDQLKFDYTFIPEQWLTGTEDIRHLGIAEGTEVFFTGLFMQNVGATRNVPIVRFGRIALAPGEPVEWGGVSRDLLLAEAFAFGGISGSPVFFHLGANRVPGRTARGRPQIRLAGVMMGAFQDVRPIGVPRTGGLAMARSNAGIAAIVPANRLSELLIASAVRRARGEP